MIDVRCERFRPRSVPSVRRRSDAIEEDHACHWLIVAPSNEYAHAITENRMQCFEKLRALRHQSFFHYAIAVAGHEGSELVCAGSNIESRKCGASDGVS